MANFMDSQGPGGQSWRQLCEGTEPSLDPSGLLGGYWGAAIQAAVQCEYADKQKLLTLERKGCCNGYCTCCFSCLPICNDNMAVYEGDVKGDAGGLENPPDMKAFISQPMCGGFFTPTVNIDPLGNSEMTPFTIKGPCFFGGWSEIFCNSTFGVNSDKTGQDMAEIKHMKPDGCCEMIQAFATPLDRYQVIFNGQMSGHDKANVVVSSLLIDYMFFEMDDGPVSCQDESIICTFCYFNCFGCLCPCEARIPCGKSKDEGGGGDGCEE